MANFKYVLDEAVAEYFMWAASDDIWDKNWLATLYPVAKENKCLAFGTIRTIDEMGQILRHPANNRLFSYSGVKLLRRIKYALEPNSLGKANPIYGLFPKKVINEEAINLLSSGLYAADTLFLYCILKQCEIKGNKEVYIYKRIHQDCASLNSQIPSNIICLYANLKNCVQLSVPLEPFLIIALFPFTSVYYMAIRGLNDVYGMAIQALNLLGRVFARNSGK